MIRIEAALILLLILVAPPATAPASDTFIRYYGDHQIVGTPTDLESVRTLVSESAIPARAVADGFLSRLDGEIPIDPDKREWEAIIDFVSRHRAAFGLKDPKDELGIVLEEQGKVPFQEERAGQQATLHLFVQYISRESSEHRLKVYTVGKSIVRIESDLKPTFDYESGPSTSPYEALDRAMYELGGEESGYYGYEILITLNRSDDSGAYVSYYTIDFTGADGRITRVRVDADTGKVIDVVNDAEPRPKAR